MPSWLDNFLRSAFNLPSPSQTSAQRAFNRAFSIEQYHINPHTGQTEWLREPRSSSRRAPPPPPKKKKKKQTHPRYYPGYSSDYSSDSDTLVDHPYAPQRTRRSTGSGRRGGAGPSSTPTPTRRRRDYHAEDVDLHRFHDAKQAHLHSQSHSSSPQEPRYRGHSASANPYADVNMENRSPRNRAYPSTPYAIEPEWEPETDSEREEATRRSRRGVNFASYDEMRHKGLYDGAEVLERRPRRR